MGGFADPFYGNVPARKLTLGELVRAIRLNVAAEEEATALYEAHAEATDNPVAKKVLIDIANEERVHVGEFVQLLEILTGDEKAWMENGYDEVNELAEDVARGDLEAVSAEEKKLAEEGVTTGDGALHQPTIGSMRE